MVAWGHSGNGQTTVPAGLSGVPGCRWELPHGRTGRAACLHQRRQHHLHLRPRRRLQRHHHPNADAQRQRPARLGRHTDDRQSHADDQLGRAGRDLRGQHPRPKPAECHGECGWHIQLHPGGGHRAGGGQPPAQRYFYADRHHQPHHRDTDGHAGDYPAQRLSPADHSLVGGRGSQPGARNHRVIVGMVKP